MQNQDFVNDKNEDEEKYDISLVKAQQSFDQKERPIQRVFWMLMALFLIGGLLGAFGSGWLSKTRAEGNEFNIKYEQLVRLETPTTMYVLVKHPEKNLISISINNAYLKNTKIEKVAPQPESIITKENESVFNFKSAENGLIIFYLQPQHSGSQKLEISIKGEKKKLNQFVYI